MLFQNYSRWIDGGDDGREARKLNEVFATENRELSHICPTDSSGRGQGALRTLKNFKRLSADTAMISQENMVTPTGLEPVFSP
jgi:hypothetical protein